MGEIALYALAIGLVIGAALDFCEAMQRAGAPELLRDDSLVRRVAWRGLTLLLGAMIIILALSIGDQP